jgi:hypothetical protein
MLGFVSRSDVGHDTMDVAVSSGQLSGAMDKCISFGPLVICINTETFESWTGALDRREGGVGKALGVIDSQSISPGKGKMTM